MADALFIDAVPGELRAALVEDGRCVEIEIHRAGHESRVGHIFLGRVERVLPGGHAAFVGLGLDRAGYLAVAPGAAPPHEGAAVIVQIVKDSQATKGPQLTAHPTLPGRYLVLTPGASGVTVSRRIAGTAERDQLAEAVRAIARPGELFTVRTAAAGAEAAALAADADAIRTGWDRITAAAARARAPALLDGGPGALARLLNDHAGTAKRIVIDDAATYAEAVALCRRHLPGGEARVALHRGSAPLFEAEGIEAALDAALSTRVALPSGGEIVIEATEALTAIDVNTQALSGVARAEDAALRTNLEAATEAARQLRLRAIGGLIVIDFAHMDEAGWARVTGALAAALAHDRTPARALGRTNAGLMEVTRSRSRPPLAVLLGAPERTAETVGFDTLRAVRREAEARRAPLARVAAAPDVAAWLAGDGTPWRDALAARLGLRIDIDPRPGWPRVRVEISLGSDG